MGLIEAIGHWVVEEICRQDAEWRAEGLRLDISFNLSPRQLWRADLVDKVMASLQSGGVDPTNVIVEVTEAAAMADVDRTEQVLSALRRHGLVDVLCREERRQTVFSASLNFTTESLASPKRWG